MNNVQKEIRRLNKKLKELQLEQDSSVYRCLEKIEKTTEYQELVKLLVYSESFTAQVKIDVDCKIIFKNVLEKIEQYGYGSVSKYKWEPDLGWLKDIFSSGEVYEFGSSPSLSFNKTTQNKEDHYLLLTKAVKNLKTKTKEIAKNDNLSYNEVLKFLSENLRVKTEKLNQKLELKMII